MNAKSAINSTISLGVKCLPASVTLVSSLNIRITSSKRVPIVWLSSASILTEPSSFNTGLLLRLIRGSTNFSINNPNLSCSESLSISFLIWNLLMITCTFSENPSKYSIKSFFSCCWFVLDFKSVNVKSDLFTNACSATEASAASSSIIPALVNCSLAFITASCFGSNTASNRLITNIGNIIFL